MTNRKRYTLDELDRMPSRSDQSRFDQTSEQDILEQAMADPDTPVPTAEELKQMKPVAEQGSCKKKK